MSRLLALLAAVVLLAVCAAPPAADVANDSAFTAQVQPLLAKHCLSCHSTAKKKADLDLSTRAGVLHGAASGPVVVPGKAAESLLLQVVAPKGDPHMPPRGQLAKEEIDVLKKWIDGLQPAAPTAGRVITDRDRQHWAFRKLARPEAPTVKDAAWVRSPIDAFVLARLEAKGLAPAPDASRRELVRRVTFDLIGLPPTPEEMDAALNDTSAQWFEKVVDRLLASPHYGERWGRHWLDLARYAESNGIGEDRERPYAWRYRDYVIRSLNADKPYAQFVREQLAGDEVAPDDPDALVATGFCRLGPTVDVIRAQDAEKYRIEELDDVVSTTSQVFLGLTLGCARCHDHKYDALLQTDYYRLSAVFNSTVKRDVALDITGPPPDPKAKGPHMLIVTDNGPAPRKTHLLWRGDFRNKGPEVELGVPVVLEKQSLTFSRPSAGTKTTGRRQVFADWLVSPDNGLAWRVMANRLWQYHFGRGLVDSSNNFGLNGDKPSHPELLDWLAAELVAREGRWKALHRTILTSHVYMQSSRYNDRAGKLDPDNRLLWRTSPHRLEAEPIRDAVLAVSGKLNRDMHGPSIKPRIHPNLLAGNRMSSWPEVKKEGPEHWRRSVYVHVKRSLQMPMLELFDAPTPTASCGRRAESTVPTQALLFMNGDFLNEQAAYFAERVRQEAGADVGKQVERAFRLALARLPDADEIKQVTAFLEARRGTLTDVCHVLLCSNEFVYMN